MKLTSWKCFKCSLSLSLLMRDKHFERIIDPLTFFHFIVRILRWNYILDARINKKKTLRVGNNLIKYFKLPRPFKISLQEFLCFEKIVPKSGRKHRFHKFFLPFLKFLIRTWYSCGSLFFGFITHRFFPFLGEVERGSLRHEPARKGDAPWK